MTAEAMSLMAAFLTAISHTATKKGVGQISPTLFLAFRWVTASLGLSLIALAMGQAGHFVLNQGVLYLLAGSIVGPMLAWGLYTRALTRLDLSVANPISHAQLVLSTILAVWWLGERPSLWVILGTGLLLLGLLLVQHSGSGDALSPARVSRIGILMVCISACCWGVNNVLFKLGVAYLPTLEANWIRTVVPAVLMSASMSLPSMVPPNLGGRWSKPRRFTWKGLAYAATSAVAVDLVGWTLRFSALRFGDLVVVSPLVNTSPLFVALIAAIHLKEPVGPVRWLGVLAVVLGVVLISAVGR